MQKILITGANGFIGRSLTRELLQHQDIEIIAAVRDIKKIEEKRNDNLNFLKVDLMKPESLKSIPKDINTVVHLANSPLTGLVTTASRSQFLNNTHITSNLLDFIEETEVTKIIFASSSLIYSGSSASPYTEEATMIPLESLGASKIASESILKANSKSKKIDTISMRIFTAYGPQSRNVQFIPEAIKKISSTGQATFGNPEVMRDFIFIDDVVSAFKKVIFKELNNDFIALNIASGMSYSIHDVVDKIKDRIDPEKEIVFSKEMQRDRGTDPDHFVDITLAQEYLDWKPKISLDQGLGLTIKYFLKNTVNS